MPKIPRLTPAQTEALLLRAGFVWLRSKGSHRIYAKNVALHLKTRKQALDAIEETAE